MKPVPRSVNLALAGLFKHPLRVIEPLCFGSALNGKLALCRAVLQLWRLDLIRGTFVRLHTLHI